MIKLNGQEMEGDFDVPKLKWYQWAWVVPALYIETFWVWIKENGIPLLIATALILAGVFLGYLIGVSDKPKINDCLSEGESTDEAIELCTTLAKPPLYALAELKINDLLSSNVWSHTNSDGTTLGQRRLQIGYNAPLGEVLAKDYCTIDKAVEAWLESPSHKDIITDKTFTKAIIVLESNGEHCYWVGEYSK